ncbi:hypothetical protein TSAR_005354 [Trichomalopsis sarcophagae]|uniref:Protein twisted gastrulation n=1 Tax=Trichomalopsis sarcophagae TaxID=543379 RepID=A0A232EWD0_9HYME|nr:hypothetical protein TSAR_005354 [Trichomalopsis sarcophagae]
MPLQFLPRQPLDGSHNRLIPSTPNPKRVQPAIERRHNASIASTAPATTKVFSVTTIRHLRVKLPVRFTLQESIETVKIMKILLLVSKAIIITAVLTIFSRSHVYGCNEAVCASTVSKCMLLNSCKCDLSTCSCCKDCFLCLNLLFDECCSCFNLCPNSNVTETIPLSKKSHVEDFDEPFPELFRALTQEPDEHKRWDSFTYQNSLPNRILSPQQEKKIEYYGQSSDRKYNHKNVKLEARVSNCTVSFLTDCHPWSKCKQSCQSMGATSYRWFHDGCCECIGESCINYGINESRCSNCPSKTKDLVEDEYDDYGQDEDYDEKAKLLKNYPLSSIGFTVDVISENRPLVKCYLSQAIIKAKHQPLIRQVSRVMEPPQSAAIICVEKKVSGKKQSTQHSSSFPIPWEIRKESNLQMKAARRLLGFQFFLIKLLKKLTKSFHQADSEENINKVVFLREAITGVKRQ